MNVIACREPRNVFAVPGLVNRLFNDPFFANGLGGGEAPSPVDEGPLALDVSENESSLIVRASLPGFRKEQIDVEVHDGILSIKATHADEKADQAETYLRRERRTRTLFRRVALPNTVEGTQADAELKDGVLTLRLAKTPEAQPRKVAIR